VLLAETSMPANLLAIETVEECTWPKRRTTTRRAAALTHDRQRLVERAGPPLPATDDQRRPALAGSVGAGRAKTVLMTSLLSIPCR
jgi:hypothetical protein